MCIHNDEHVFFVTNVLGQAVDECGAYYKNSYTSFSMEKSLVAPKSYQTHKEALEVAKKLSTRNGVKYLVTEARYSVEPETPPVCVKQLF